MFRSDLPPAEAIERQYRLLALILFLLALIHLLIVARILVEVASVLPILKYAQFGLAAIMFPSIAVLIFWKIHLLRSVPDRSYLAEPEGYAWEVWKKAMVHSWAATLLVLTSAGKMEQRFNGNVELLTSSCLAIMLGVFSVSFFFHYRTAADEEVDESEGK